MERLPPGDPQGPSTGSLCGHCCYHWHYRNGCDASQLECLSQIPGYSLLYNYTSTKPLGIQKQHTYLKSQIVGDQPEPEPKGISHPQLHMPKPTKPLACVFLFDYWHTNNTSTTVHAAGLVSPSTKTEDQNSLCSGTLCSVAREFLWGLYLLNLRVPTRFLLRSQ